MPGNRTGVGLTGPIDLLVNNAGVCGPVGPAWEVDADEWWRTIEVNLRAVSARPGRARRSVPAPAPPPAPIRSTSAEDRGAKVRERRVSSTFGPLSRSVPTTSDGLSMQLTRTRAPTGVLAYPPDHVRDGPG